MTTVLLPQRLEEELDIHQSLSAGGTHHPNVLYMDSWFQDESYYYLILEICPHQVRHPYSRTRQEGNIEWLTLPGRLCARADSAGATS